MANIAIQNLGGANGDGTVEVSITDSATGSVLQVFEMKGNDARVLSVAGTISVSIAPAKEKTESQD